MRQAQNGRTDRTQCVVHVSGYIYHSRVAAS